MQLDSLEKVERQYLRKLLGLLRDSTVAGLFTETGIIPCAAKRIIGAVGFVAALLQLPDGLPAKHALFHSVAMAAAGQASFYSKFLMRLAHWNVQLGPLKELDQKRVSHIAREIVQVEFQRLHCQIEACPKSTMLVRQSWKRSKPRAYLAIPNYKHRQALVRLLFSQSALADELGRYDQQYAHPDERWCRLCSLRGTYHLENGLELIFACPHPAITALRRIMVSHSGEVWRTYGTPIERLQEMLDDAQASRSLAAFVYRANAIIRAERWERTDWHEEPCSDEEALLTDSDEDECQEDEWLPAVNSQAV